MSSIPEWMRRNHYQEEDPGTVWTKDEGVAIGVDEDRAPHRMYYAGWSSDPVEGRIFSATSDEGVAWVKDEEAAQAEQERRLRQTIAPGQGGSCGSLRPFGRPGS